MKSSEFYELVLDRFAAICETHHMRRTDASGFVVRFDGPDVFVTVAYDAFRSQELTAGVGLHAGISHPVERPFQLSELLRAVGRDELPEAQLQEIVAKHAELGPAIDHLAGLLSTYGREALAGDRQLFARLDAQRDLDCFRYAHDRPLGEASRQASVAWSKRQYGAVVSLLAPFASKLTLSEKEMFETAKVRANGPQ